MQTWKVPDGSGAGAQIPLLHATRGPLGVHAVTFVVHVAGGTDGVPVDAAHEPPEA
jgi:hypothetical protein